MSANTANKPFVDSISQISSIDESPRQSLIDPTPQTLYSTALRYEQTNKRRLLKTLRYGVKSHRYKLCYGTLCVLTFVISYQFILYLQSDLCNNYSFSQPLLIQYISYSLFPIFIGLPLVHPLWIIANKYHKSSSNTKIIINKNNSQYLYKKHNKHNTLSEITSTSYEYEFDEEYDEYDGACILDDVIMDYKHKEKESATELGMLSELSFNDLCAKKQYKNGMFPYYKTPSSTKANLKTLKMMTKSDCGVILMEKDEINSNINCKQKQKQIIVRSNRDISCIPQSVFHKLHLPFRSFSFYFRKMGIYLFIFLFIINAFSSILWIKSIQNGISAHFHGFYVENSIHCLRVIICYILRIYYDDNVSVIWNICCLLMLIFGLMTILYDNWSIFDAYDDILHYVILGLSPILNGILAVYFEYISSKFIYKQSIAMCLGDIVFILGVNGICNLCILWIILLISHYTDMEEFVFPQDFEIIWRLIVIAALWWIYNVSLFLGITLLNAVIIGFGFALCIPFNILFDQILFNDNDDKQFYLLQIIAICLITAPFIMYEMQFYVLYIMYCRGCITKCMRRVHSTTRYRFYGRCCAK